MSQQYFTNSEWSMLMQAPIQAVSAVILADKSDPVLFLREVRAALRILAAEQQRTDFSSDLERSLMQSFKDKMATEVLQGDSLFQQKFFEYLASLEQYKSADEGRKAAIAYLNEVSSILAAKVTVVQAQEFNNWLIAIARQVAEAVKEESFFGIGGEPVTRQEAAVLSDIEKALAIKG